VKLRFNYTQACIQQAYAALDAAVKGNEQNASLRGLSRLRHSSILLEWSIARFGFTRSAHLIF
jgi:hypothetical protein